MLSIPLNIEQSCPSMIILITYTLFQAQAFKKFVPMFDRILVERFLPELKTKGGIMLPEKSQGKMVQATVVAVGPGARGEVLLSLLVRLFLFLKTHKFT